MSLKYEPACFPQHAVAHDQGTDFEPKDGLQGVSCYLHVEAMGAMALRPICDSLFTSEDYNTYMAHPWSPFPLRRAHPRPAAAQRV